jgi:predicted metal-dependent phosphoesterase TrpH
VIALTDHDTMDGVEEAVCAARDTGLEIVPGVEINSEGEWGDIHFLGFYVDVRDRPLHECLDIVRDGRVARAKAMVARLRAMGMSLAWEEVRALASGPSVGRPHIARALADRGYVASTQDAFDRLIGLGGPAYVSRVRMPPRDVIRAILGAGGVPVMAHPFLSGPEAVAMVPEFVDLGLRGLEVYYPAHSAEQCEALLGMCELHGLLATGGTDFHAPISSEGAMLGSVPVPMECAARLREAALGPDGTRTTGLRLAG